MQDAPLDWIVRGKFEETAVIDTRTTPDRDTQIQRSLFFFKKKTKWANEIPSGRLLPVATAP